MHMSHVRSQVTWILQSFCTLGWQCLRCVDAVTSNPLTSVTSKHVMHTQWWYRIFLITTTVSKIIICITLFLLRARDNQMIIDKSTVCHFVPYHKASAKEPSMRQVLKISSLVDWSVHTMSSWLSTGDCSRVHAMFTLRHHSPMKQTQTKCLLQARI